MTHPKHFTPAADGDAATRTPHASFRHGATRAAGTFHGDPMNVENLTDNRPVTLEALVVELRSDNNVLREERDRAREQLRVAREELAALRPSTPPEAA